MTISRPFLLVLSALLILNSCAYQKTKTESRIAASGRKNLRSGITHFTKGCYRTALEHFLTAHEKFSAVDDIRSAATSLDYIGNTYRKLGRIQEAILMTGASARLFEQAGDKGGKVQALADKAAALVEGKRYAEAEAVIQEAEHIAARAGIKNIPLLHNRAILLLRTKRTERANQILTGILNSKDSTPSDVAAAAFALGKSAAEKKLFKEARQLFEKALKIDKKQGLIPAIADDLYAIGTLYAKMRRPDAAEGYLARAGKIYALLGNRKKAGTVLDAMKNLNGSLPGDLEIWLRKWLSDGVNPPVCSYP